MNGLGGVKTLLSWLPPEGTVWHVAAGEYWDTVRTSHTWGAAAIQRLGDQCGPVICDPWTRIVHFLVESGCARRWGLPETVLCSESTYVAVPSLSADTTVLHWLITPTFSRCTTDTELLHLALRAVVDALHHRREGS